MIRKQLYLDDDLDTALKVLAERTGESEASHVRAAVRQYVAEHLPPQDTDPLDDLLALVPDPDGPKDVAIAHDRYLYGSA